jgi:hypothetical protein
LSNSRRISISTMKNQQNQIEDQTSPDLVMITRSACLLIASLNTLVLPIAFTVEHGVVHKI